MSKHSHIEVKLIEHYQEVFFDAFPEIAKWHRWVAEQVQTTGEITTMLGRTRRFFGRPNDDATIREAVAYEPQSVAADYCNRALLRLYNMGDKFPAIIRLSKHDELVVTCNESLEEQVISIMREQMEEHITLTSPNGKTRNWFVPAETESGWNLGKRVVDKDTKEVTNPNGISHPLDGRTRIDTLSWKTWKL
jgi:DNA polymerase I-like protein with 3'-5' exonuclease and polymerase domains